MRSAKSKGVELCLLGRAVSYGILGERRTSSAIFIDRGAPTVKSNRALALNRRELIGRSATLATACVADRESARAGEGYAFTLGVASGEPTHDGVVLWTRLAPTPLALDGLGGMSKPVSVTWDVATDDTMRNVVRTGLVEADRRFAYSVHVEVGGLEPGRPYWYRFTALC